MIRSGKVFIKNELAGVIAQDEDGYIFTYDAAYSEKPDSEPVSLTFPVKKESYRSNQLFPFFDGLIPEGWLLDIAEKNWKIDRGDRMELLLTVCRDCIGAVSIIKEDKE